MPKKTPTRTGPLKRRKATRKEETIHVRVTAEQKAILAEAAERAGLGTSSWMLVVALREARAT